MRSVTALTALPRIHTFTPGTTRVALNQTQKYQTSRIFSHKIISVIIKDSVCAAKIYLFSR